MSGDHHTNHPVHGTAAGDPYVALPPTAVDATASGPTRLIVAWPGFDPPRTASALAAAIPMTGVPVWRVYLDLPGRSPGGLGSGAILETETIETYCAAVENAVERLPAALADIRRDLGLHCDPDAPDGSVGLAGFSAGGAAALLAVARGAVPVSAVALVAPVVAPSRAARAVEKRSGRDRSWTDRAAALADRLDLGSLVGDLAGRDVATLLIGGARDRVVPAREITSLRDLLRRHGTGPVESATFRMGHALAAEPGTEARPPITEAVRVDGVLTDWFRERLAQPTEPPAAPPPEETALAEEQPTNVRRPTGPWPVNALPANASPTETRPTETARADARPTEARASATQPSDAQTTNAQHPTAAPATANTHPVNNRPVDATRATTQPISIPSAKAQPPAVQPTSVHPMDASADDAQPVNTRPTDTSPSNAKPSTPKQGGTEPDTTQRFSSRPGSIKRSAVASGPTEASGSQPVGSTTATNAEPTNPAPAPAQPIDGRQEPDAASASADAQAEAGDAQAGAARTSGARPTAGGDGAWSASAQDAEPGAQSAAKQHSAAAGCGFGHGR